jgi:ABC-type uncharacterized transport system ATPase component
MKNTICGIEITQEHADKITETIKQIYQDIEQQDFNRFYKELEYTLKTRNSPHNNFKGTASEYIKKYFPEKIPLLNNYLESEINKNGG